MKLKYNISAYFIAPCLAIKVFAFIAKRGMLINTYIKTNSRIKADFFIHVKFENYNNETVIINNIFRQNENFVMSYNVNYNEVVYAFNFSTIFRKDVDLIIEGKYKNVSNLYKKLFENHQEESLQIQVFNNSPILRDYYETLLDQKLPDDISYFSKMDLNKETL